MPPIALVVAARAGQQAVQRNAAAAGPAASNSSGAASGGGGVHGGAAAAADNYMAEGMNGVSRKLLVATLKRRSRRARHCRSLPVSFFFFSLFIWAMFVHVNVGNSFDVERGCV
jgi:hypothetical protein